MKCMGIFLASGLALASAVTVAQAPDEPVKAPVAMPPRPGEIWAVTTVTEFVAARETTPKREKQ